MKRVLYLFAFLAGFFLLTGMGGMEERPSDRVPTPENNFSATFIDKQDVVTKIMQVSRQGEVFLLGKKGKGTVTVSFKKINTVEFKNEKNMMTAVIELTNGKNIELKVDKNHTFYGKVDFGTFQIKTADLKKIIFNH